MSFDLVYFCFGKLQIALFTWLCMFVLTSCAVYNGFHHWSKKRIFYIIRELNLRKDSTTVGKNKIMSKKSFFLRETKITKNYLISRFIWLFMARLIFYLYGIVYHCTCGYCRKKPNSTRVIIGHTLRTSMFIWLQFISKIFEVILFKVKNVDEILCICPLQRSKSLKKRTVQSWGINS